MLGVLVLSSAAGSGFPQWNCNCENCRRARDGDPATLPRTQSSIAVTAGNGHWFLLNASPDLRQQINQLPALHPSEGWRHSPIAGVVLTNADVDHVAVLAPLSRGEAHRQRRRHQPDLPQNLPPRGSSGDSQGCRPLRNRDIRPPERSRNSGFAAGPPAS